MKEEILIIEDDGDISRLLAKVLEDQGYVTEIARNGLDGLSKAMDKDFSLIVLDLMLPLKTGEEVLRDLRVSKDTPVIVLSAKNMVHDRIELLRLGADDYITKPFDIDELALRVGAVLRRTRPQADMDSRISFRDITMDMAAKRVYVGTTEVVLTAMEYAILELLLKNPHQIFSKARLFTSVCGETYISGDNTIHVHMSNIRKKLGAVSDVEYIETVYGMGYRLVQPKQELSP